MRWGQLKDTISDPRASKREIGRGAPWLCEAPFLLPPGRTWPTQSSLACWRTPRLALPLASLRTTAPAEREYGRMRETLHLQLLLRLIKALGVWGVDDIDEDVRVVKIVPPVRPESCMTPAHIAKKSHLIFRWPPMSQTLSLNPSVWTDLMLNPCVGVMVLMSSLARVLRIVVLPALSRPSSRIRSSRSGDAFSFLGKLNVKDLLGKDLKNRGWLFAVGKDSDRRCPKIETQSFVFCLPEYWQQAHDAADQ